MADPLSITGLVLSVGSVIKSLVKYCGDVRDAGTEIRSLHNELLAELFALQGAMVQLTSGQSKDSEYDVKSRGPEFDLMVRSAHETLTKLAEDLGSTEDKSRVRGMVSRLQWHWKKEDVQMHIQRVERVKSWFILLLTTDIHGYGQDIISQMAQLNMNLEKDIEKRQTEEDRLERSRQSEAMQWLAPVDPDDKFRKALLQHYPGTCQWFIDGPVAEMLRRLPEKSEVIWLKGKSGSGKTTLIAHVVKCLLSQLSDGSGVAYFFCSFDDLSTQEPLNIMGSMAKQLSTLLPEMVDQITSQFEKHTQPPGRNSRLSLAELEDMLVRYLKKLKRFIVVIDAVNESEHKSEVTLSISKLASRLENLQVIISSTSDHCFTDEHDSQPFSVLEVEMQSDLVDNDIQCYLRGSLDPRSSFSADLKREVEESIMKESRGTFRYARWQTDNILKQRTARAARRALSDMPQDLNETYCQLLCRIKQESDRAFLRRALLWLSCVCRPLRLAELNEAVVIEDGDTSINDECRFLDNPEFLLDLAQGLLDWNTSQKATGDTVVSLSHSSVKTFLTSEWIKSSPAAEFSFDEGAGHMKIIEACLAYLGFVSKRKSPFFVDWRYSHVNILQRLATEFPLINYTAWNWPLHIKAGVQTPSDWTIINRFLSARSGQTSSRPNDQCQGVAVGGYYNWIQLITGGVDDWVVDRTYPLYYASSFGYTALAEAMLKYDKYNTLKSLEAPGGRAGSTALQVACYRRHLEAAGVLVEVGANPLSLDGTYLGQLRPEACGLPSLWWAVENGPEWSGLVGRMMEKWTAPGSEVNDVLESLMKHSETEEDLARYFQSITLKEDRRSEEMG